VSRGYGEVEGVGVNEVEQIKRHLQTVPPSCVVGFRLAPAELPIEWDDSCRSVWRLACGCGGEQGRVLGYPLGDYKALPGGPDCFISPIGFECSTCGKVTEVIDTDLHGYHAEVGKREGGIGSVKYRGEGPRAAWPCPQCGGQVFGLTVAFIFWGAVFDLADEPGWPLQEFFNVFLPFARCGRLRALVRADRLRQAVDA
jgi:hypothetical protein